MQLYYCENCKNKNSSELPDKTPTFKGIDATKGIKCSSLLDALNYSNHPKFKGTACADCERSFSDTETRWFYAQTGISTFGELKLIRLKNFKWKKAANLADQTK